MVAAGSKSSVPCVLMTDTLFSLCLEKRFLFNLQKLFLSNLLFLDNDLALCVCVIISLFIFDISSESVDFESYQ